MLEHFEVVTHTCLIAGRSADVVLAIAFASGATVGAGLAALMRRVRPHGRQALRTPPNAPAMPIMRAHRRSVRRQRLLTRHFDPTLPAAPPLEEDALTRAYVRSEGDNKARSAFQEDDDRTLTMPGVTEEEVRRELDEHRSRR